MRLQELVRLWAASHRRRHAGARRRFCGIHGVQCVAATTIRRRPGVCPAPGNGLAMAMPCETLCTANTRPSSPRCVGASEAGQGVGKANAHGYAGLIELDEACQRHRVFQAPHREGKHWRQRRVLRVAHRAVSSEPGASQPASHRGPRRPRGPPWIPARSGPLRCGPGAARRRSPRARSRSQLSVRNTIQRPGMPSRRTPGAP